jgi:hypothetical protein
MGVNMSDANFTATNLLGELESARDKLEKKLVSKNLLIF